MLKTMIVSAAALALLAGVALAAQDNLNTVQTLPSADTQIADNASGNPPPPPPPGDDQGQGGGWWQGWMGHGHRGHHRGGPEGPDGMGGPGGPGGPMMGAMMRGPGFHMHLGPGIDVGVMCGQEVMKDCMASAQPLIDAAKAAAAAQPAAPKAP